MISPPICLTGKITQSDTDTLREQALAQIEEGAIEIRATDLEAIEFGPLQVLLCLAKEAGKGGLPCKLDIGGSSAIDDCLAAVHLPDSATLFTTPGTAEVPARS